MDMLKFTVFIECDKESGWFVATCPALKGCVSQGATEEDAVKNIKEAIIGWLTVQNDRAAKEAKKQAALAHHEPKELALNF